MIMDRERAMIDKNIDLVMPQFSEDATWINSQGYLFEGKKELEKFHVMFAENDSLNYYYEIGNPRIRFLDGNNALAYYSWKMFWFKKENPADTTFKEIGLMTLNAQKQNEKWKWVAVTNQHTPWFYKKIEPVKIE
ncbi:nuclear transport factor 2 family protein [Flagellimonas sp. 2504JD1-5]